MGHSIGAADQHIVSDAGHTQGSSPQGGSKADQEGAHKEEAHQQAAVAAAIVSASGLTSLGARRNPRQHRPALQYIPCQQYSPVIIVACSLALSFSFGSRS